jgi:hypothetical protein
MNLSRTVVIGVIGGALAAWFAAASTTGTHQRDIVMPAKPSALDKSGADLAAEIGRLHERLHPTSAPQQPARDLFEYGGAPAPAAAAAPAADVIVPPAQDAPAPPAAPAFALVGIAEDAGVRSAIVTGAGDLLIVREGERVGRYSVSRIDPTSIVLADPDGGPSLQLDLPR